MFENKILLKIFNLKNFANETIRNCEYLILDSGLVNYKLNKNGFKKIKKYLNIFNYNIDDLVNLCSLSLQDKSGYNIIENIIIDIIKKNKEQIFLDLENKKINENSFNKNIAGVYKQIVNGNYPIIEILDNIFYFSRENLEKNDRRNINYIFNGVEYLMKILFINFSSDFKDFFLKTKNENLKLIFVNGCLYDLDIEGPDWLINKNNLKSKILIVKIINIMSYFKIAPREFRTFNFFKNEDLKFTDMAKRKYNFIPNDDKLQYLFFYLK